MSMERIFVANIHKSGIIFVKSELKSPFSNISDHTFLLPLVYSLRNEC